MNRIELAKAIIQDGRPIIAVEYRKATGDTVRRRAAKQGESAIMPQAKHIVLVGDTSFEKTEWLPDGADVSKVQGLYPRGAKVLMELRSMERTDYGNRIEGEFLGELTSDKA